MEIHQVTERRDFPTTFFWEYVERKGEEREEEGEGKRREG